jgi:protein-tyrosine-phosphatase
MAAAVANALAREPLRMLPESVRDCAVPEWDAFSAGLSARDGEPIAKNAVDALEAAEIPVTEGRDYHRHRAHRLTAEEAERFDLLVGLTREHAMALLFDFPQLSTRICAFPEDIPDPFGGDGETYRACLQAIERGVRTLFGNEEHHNAE